MKKFGPYLIESYLAWKTWPLKTFLAAVYTERRGSAFEMIRVHPRESAANSFAEETRVFTFERGDEAAPLETSL